MEGMLRSGDKSIAVVRIATGIIFLFFAEYKIAGPEFAHGGFEGWIHEFVDQGMAVGFFKVVLVKFALVHPVFCAELVAWGELAIGLSLVPLQDGQGTSRMNPANFSRLESDSASACRRST